MYNEGKKYEKSKHTFIHLLLFKAITQNYKITTFSWNLICEFLSLTNIVVMNSVE